MAGKALTPEAISCPQCGAARGAPCVIGAARRRLRQHHHAARVHAAARLASYEVPGGQQ